MTPEKLKIFLHPHKLRPDEGKELLLRCGEVVPLSGIYEFVHPSHDQEQQSEMVVAIRGEHVEPCRGCGEHVLLRLLHAAPHISEDHDFCGMDPNARNQ
ncbi:MAG TPA: hypothetical protein VGL89_18705 [Candidatus Koribacter sp.]